MRGPLKMLMVIGALSLVPTGALAQDTLVIGAKNFTESAVLAEIMAQTIEEHTDLAVERRFNLGGTMICWSALQAGEIDLYPEYTGTGWAAILGESSKVTDPLVTFLTVRRRFEAEHQILWMDPFGLNNTYAISMPESRAQELGINRISDLVEHQE